MLTRSPYLVHLHPNVPALFKIFTIFPSSVSVPYRRESMARFEVDNNSPFVPGLHHDATESGFLRFPAFRKFCSFCQTIPVQDKPLTCPGYPEGIGVVDKVESSCCDADMVAG